MQPTIWWGDGLDAYGDSSGRGENVGRSAAGANGRETTDDAEIGRGVDHSVALTFNFARLCCSTGLH